MGKTTEKLSFQVLSSFDQKSYLFYQFYVFRIKITLKNR